MEKSIGRTEILIKSIEISSVQLESQNGLNFWPDPLAPNKLAAWPMHQNAYGVNRWSLFDYYSRSLRSHDKSAK